MEGTGSSVPASSTGTGRRPSVKAIAAIDLNDRTIHCYVDAAPWHQMMPNEDLAALDFDRDVSACHGLHFYLFAFADST